jgi:hypothetical protein
MADYQWQTDLVTHPGAWAGTYNRYNAGIPAGSRIAAYVRTTGFLSGSDWAGIESKMETTLNAALALCEDGVGDTVVVLPGHTENVASADAMSNLKAGTRIVGLGFGANRPTFTWTTAVSSFLFDVANVTIENCILNLEPGTGTVTVAAPITISAAGCGIIGCQMRMSTDANNKATIPITTTAAADDLSLIGNLMYGATAGEVTTGIDIIGCDRLRMIGNHIGGATSDVAVGIVRFATTASLDITLESNTYRNLKALSTCAVTGLANVTGVSKYEHFHYLDTASTTCWLTSAGKMTFHRPTVTNTTAETGTETAGTVSA